jgi:hypothetical protein
VSGEDRARLRIERRLARQSVVHHLKREQQLEQLLADAMALARTKCKCGACKALRNLLDELEGA